MIVQVFIVIVFQRALFTEVSVNRWVDGVWVLARSDIPCLLFSPSETLQFSSTQVVGTVQMLCVRSVVLDSEPHTEYCDTCLSMCFFFGSVHLYYLFPSLEEGGLATYRTAIVQNQHLAMLAKVQVSALHLQWSLHSLPQSVHSFPFESVTL